MLLDNMGQLMGEQVLAFGAVRMVLSFIEIDITAMGKRLGVQLCT